MKRIIPLILTVLLLPTLLAVPALADELGGVRINLLDYTTPNGVPGFTASISPGSKTVNFSLPYATDIAYIDVTFYTDAVSFTDLYSTDGHSNYLLTYQYVGGGLYRAFGSVSFNNASLTALMFEDLDGTYDVTFNTFYVYTTPTEASAIGATIQAPNDTNDPVSFAYSGSPVYHFWTISNDSWSTRGAFESRIELVNYWRGYDYIDIQVSYMVAGINSVTVICGENNVPFELNQIENVSAGALPIYYLSLRLDLTGLERNDDKLVVIINGVNGQESRGENGFWFHSCTGYLEVVERNMLGYYFSQVAAWIQSQTNSLLSGISSGVSNITGTIASWGRNIVNGFTSVTDSIATWGQNIVDAINGSGDPSQIQQDINAAVDDLHQAGAAMDAVDRPDLGKVNIDVAGMFDPDGMVGVGAIASVFTGNSLIYSIMVMFVTLALISYILFGKR